ncbi:MAG: hypothetical protein CMK09_12035 [Ponticaulis sp.]|nr:hypothetical protein [Ponticaulis sp.]|tara:strand:- start:44085 stop:45035 length:951 start_codon:yes stop_codon:yes gene_type:complete
MTHLIRTSLVALSLAALSGNALAQNAPIRIGPGGAEYQTGPTAEQLMARQAARITDLEEQLSRLTGRIEQMEFRLAERESAYEDALEANQDLRDQMAEINGRLRTLETRTPPSSSRSTSSTTSPRNTPFGSSTEETGPRSLAGGPGEQIVSRYPAETRQQTGPRPLTPGASTRQTSSPQSSMSMRLPGDPDALFEHGKNRLLMSDHAGAEIAFQTFLEQFPDDNRQGEANYWVGEALYLQGDYAGSAEYLKTFVHNFASDPRRADGVVKLARALIEIDETGQACEYLDRIGLLDPETVTDRTRDAAAVQRRNAGCS